MDISFALIATFAVIHGKLLNREGRERALASHVEADAQDVAVRHHVVLSFELQLPGLARRMLRPVPFELIKRRHLRANEAALEIRMDSARSLSCSSTSTDGPRANLVLANREKRDEIEQTVRCPDESRQGRLAEAEIGEKRRLVRS